MKRLLFGLAATVSALAFSAPAHAASIDVDLAGWETFGGLLEDGNTELLVDLGAGATVTGFEYIGLEFDTENGSWRSELVLSVNSEDFGSWLDWKPSTDDSEGSFGPASGSWGGASGQDGPLPSTGAFVADNGMVFVTVYESIDDPSGDADAPFIRDAVISQGTLRIEYTPAIPEPGTYALMALGLLAVGAAARRRRG